MKRKQLKTKKSTPPPLWMVFADFKAAAVMYATHSETRKITGSAVLQAMDCIESELHASARWSLSAERNNQILNEIKRRLVLQVAKAEQSALSHSATYTNFYLRDMCSAVVQKLIEERTRPARRLAAPRRISRGAVPQAA